MCRHDYGHMCAHVYGLVYGCACKHVPRYLYRHVYRQMHRHTHRHVRGPAHRYAHGTYGHVHMHVHMHILVLARFDFSVDISLYIPYIHAAHMSTTKHGMMVRLASRRLKWCDAQRVCVDMPPVDPC